MHSYASGFFISINMKMYFKEDCNESIAYCEAIGLSKVFAEYAEHWSRTPISMVGFNESYGNVFIWMEDAQVSIASCMGQSVHYVYYDYQKDEEIELNSYIDFVVYTETN